MQWLFPWCMLPLVGNIVNFKGDAIEEVQPDLCWLKTTCQKSSHTEFKDK